ncbi:MAG: 2,3-bisphosphoglycerate-dependent phosphoglycerate mutase, partial [Bacteroidales bacterium]|nr:2,3-bisphosphoglycerate-dependent phosphoglycerate mutase [Bacteroidales bacterium]
RRSNYVAHNPVAASARRDPQQEAKYAGVDKKLLPHTEALKDTVARIVPYWTETIVPALKHQDEILIAAHGNSLRGIIKHIKGISDDDIVSLNLPTAVPYLFEFDDDMNLLKDEFLGDPEKIKALMEAVANQGKAKK